jgi:hypothetical protein
MTNREILMMASVLALFRGETTVRGVAERFGVTEAQVMRWMDVFEIAGTLALAELICGKQSRAEMRRRLARRTDKGSEPTTFPCGETTTPEPSEPTTFPCGETTTPEPGEPTTTPEPGADVTKRSPPSRKRRKSKRTKR